MLLQRIRKYFVEVFGDVNCCDLGRQYKLLSSQGDQVSDCWDFHVW